MDSTCCSLNSLSTPLLTQISFTTKFSPQIKQFPDFAAQMMEQHLSCLPKVQEWQANVQEWQSNVVPKMMGTSSDGPSADTNPEEDDRNDSYLSGPLNEDSTKEIRVM